MLIPTKASHTPILICLFAVLRVSIGIASAQSVDEPQDTPHVQSVPHQQRVSKTQSVDKPQSASAAVTITQLCKPQVTDNIIVVTAQQRKSAGNIALPPLTDQANGFAWPDTELGVVKMDSGYAFFGSDGAFHARQDWEDLIEGNTNTAPSPAHWAPSTIRWAPRLPSM